MAIAKKATAKKSTAKKAAKKTGTKKTATKKTATQKSATTKTGPGFSAEEKAAMKQRAAELKAEKAGQLGLADVEKAVAGLQGTDRLVGEKLLEIVPKVAPHLVPRTWYGFPAWAKDGKVTLFYQPASKFGTRYGTLGFNDSASLDSGPMWPTHFAIDAMNATVAKEISALVKRAAG